MDDNLPESAARSAARPLPLSSGFVGGEGARRATLFLLIVSIFWGGTFLWMELGTESLRRIFGSEARLTSAAFFLTARYLAALVLLPLFVPASVRRLDRRAWRNGFLLSIPFAAGSVLQVFGLAQDDVAPSQSAFLTSLYVVVTPLLAAFVTRRLPALGVLVGIPLATFGAAYIAGPPTGGLSPGAWSTLASAIAFSGQIVMTDYASRRADPLALTFAMLVFTVPWTVATLLAAPGGLETLAPHQLAAAFTDSTFLVTMLTCALLATVIALSVLNRWQREIHPSRAAILYTSEPVFASILSVLAGRDAVTGWLVLGALAIFAANLAAAFLGKPAASREAPETA